MLVKFKSNKLKKQYEDSDNAISAYGEDVGKKYISRINIIKSSNSVNDLMAIPLLRCHPLTGDRKGEWSLTIKGRYRLIFTLHGEKLEIARIEEVSKHYDD